MGKSHIVTELLLCYRMVPEEDGFLGVVLSSRSVQVRTRANSWSVEQNVEEGRKATEVPTLTSAGHHSGTALRK